MLRVMDGDLKSNFIIAKHFFERSRCLFLRMDYYPLWTMFQPEVVFRSTLGYLINESGAFLLADTSEIPTSIPGLCIKRALLVELNAGDRGGYLCNYLTVSLLTQQHCFDHLYSGSSKTKSALRHRHVTNNSITDP